MYRKFKLTFKKRASVHSNSFDSKQVKYTSLNMFVMGRAMERSLVDHLPFDREIEAVFVNFYFGRNQLNFFKN